MVAVAKPIIRVEEKISFKKEKFHPKTLRNYLIITGLLSILGILHLIQCANVIKSGNEIIDLKYQMELYTKENKQLIYEIEKLKSFNRIEKIAKNNLEMVEPKITLRVKIIEKVAPELAKRVNKSNTDS